MVGAKPHRRGAMRKRRGVLFYLSVASLAAAILVVGLIGLGTDRHWLPTLLAYLPRWPQMIFASAALLFALLGRHWKLSAAALATWIASFLVVLDYQAVHGTCGAGKPETKVRVITQNLAGKDAKAATELLIKAHDPDLILMQECSVPGLASEATGTHPGELIGAPGYTIAQDFNTCIVSRYPILTIDARPREEIWKQGGSGAIALFEIDAPWGRFWVGNVHLETIREGLSGFVKYRFGGLKTMEEAMAQRSLESGLAAEWMTHAKGPLLVAGDFNVTDNSALLKTHFGAMETTFEACGRGFGDTKTTKALRGKVSYGTRIDHILFDTSWTASSAEPAAAIDSDHTGVVSDLYLRP